MCNIGLVCNTSKWAPLILRTGPEEGKQRHPRDVTEHIAAEPF